MVDTLKALAGTVAIDVTYGATMPYDLQDKWQREAHGYRVTLKYQRRRYTCNFWMGSAHTDEPTSADVLNSLLLDASADAMSFEDWCSDFGAEPDSRKAERTYRACLKAAKGIKRLLGADYDRFRDAEGL